jgi:hypothetical protein
MPRRAGAGSPIEMRWRLPVATQPGHLARSSTQIVAHARSAGAGFPDGVQDSRELVPAHARDEGSQPDSLDLVLREAFLRSVVKFRRARAFVRGHGLRVWIDKDSVLTSGSWPIASQRLTGPRHCRKVVAPSP